MTSEFSINVNMITSLSLELSTAAGRIHSDAGSVTEVCSLLLGEEFSSVRSSIRTISSQLKEEADRITKYGYGLKRIATTYKNYDREVAGYSTVPVSQKNPTSKGGSGSGKTKNQPGDWTSILLEPFGFAKAGIDIVEGVNGLAGGTREQIIGGMKIVKGAASLGKTVGEFVSDVQDQSWWDAVKNACGGKELIKAEDIVPGKTFGKYLGDELSDEISKFGDFSSKTKALGTVAKWAGAVTELVSEGFENYDEFKDSGNWVRMGTETVLEAGTDLGLAMGGSAVAGAALAALGVTPVGWAAIGCTVAGAGLVFALNEGSKALFGKDVGEVVSDFVCDTAEWIGETAANVGEAVYNTGKEVVNAIGEAGKAVGKAVSDAAGAVGKVGETVASWFKPIFSF